MAEADMGPPQGSAASTTMRWASSFFLLGFFLYLGLQLRRFKFLRVFSLPAAVSGGFIGLAFIQLCKLNPDLYEVIQYDWIVGWSALPSILINVVFATLFLGKELPSPRQAWREGGPQVMFGQIIAWGNWTVSCLITGAILIPAFGVSPLFASMYAVGFEGGHGTAAGLSESYASLGYPEYGDIAVTSATIGILMGSVVGVCLVNWGVATKRLAWQQDGSLKGTHEDSADGIIQASVSVSGIDDIKEQDSPNDNENDKVNQGCFAGCSRDVPEDLYPLDERPSAGVQTVRQDAIESLGLHMVYISFACFFGYGILRLLWLIEDAVPALQEIRFFRSFPLFPMCMLGGMLIMWLHSITKSLPPIDALLMERISGAAMEFLIVSAIANINTSAVSSNIAPLLIIIVGGISWNFVCFFCLAPRLLPDCVFERAIVELGQSFGTTATGLLLLRMVDPDKETTAWRAFSYKQMMTEPFMGGGIWTTVSLPLLTIIGVWGVFGISAAAVSFWFGMYFFYFRGVYARMKEQAASPAELQA